MLETEVRHEQAAQEEEGIYCKSCAEDHDKTEVVKYVASDLFAVICNDKIC